MFKDLIPVLFASLLLASPALAQEQYDGDDAPQDPFAESAEEQGENPRLPAGLQVPAGGPPNFIPPPPPNMQPPSSPPPGVQQGNQARPQSNSRSQRSGNGQQQSGNGNSVGLHGSSLSLAEGLNPNDPVGLIRIPDLGTQEVLQMLENFTGKSILRQQNLPGVKITFYSQGSMTREEAILAIESLLSLNGIAITHVGDQFLKAVPAATVTTQVPPIWEGSTLTAEPSQKIYSKLFKLDFLTTEEALPLLQGFLTQGAPIAFTKNNTLLITDALINLQRIETLLERIDTPPPLGSEMLFFKLENIAAEDVVARLEALREGSLANRLQNNTTFDADERTNQLIVFTHPANVEIIEQVVERLDVDSSPRTSTEVFYVKHAEAVEVARLIDEVITGQEQAREDGQGSNNRRRRTPSQQQQANAASAALTGEGMLFSNYVTLTADERANTIIISGTPSDIKAVEELVTKIDVLLAQVRIEVVITEVTLNDEESRGIDQFGFSYNQSGEGGNPATTDGGQGKNWIFDQTIFGGGTDGTSGIGIGPVTTGPAGFSISGVLGVAEAKSNVRVLSAPTIVTTHNREASILIGQEVPIVTQTQSSDVSDNFRSNIQYRDVAIELTVTPLIGNNGIIQMEIEQRIENIITQQTIAGAGDQPIIGSRKANSYVSVSDGQMVVLGGLQSSEESDTKSKMSLLGRIPVLGDYLFTKRNQNNERRELLIFIRPVIVNNTTEANTDAERQLDIMEESDRVRDYLDRGTLRPRPEPEEPEAEEEKPDIRGGRRM